MEFFEKDLGKILKRNALGLRRIFNQTRSDCGRVYDRNLEQYPVTIDLYGPYAKITDYTQEGLTEETAAEVMDIARRMLYIEQGKVVLQRRAKVGREQHEKQSDEPLLVQVRENGHLFKVDLASRIDTGLFLDQANNRKVVEDSSQGRDVLNLFSHTGAFSVYAAAGGARSVTSVDLSNTYTAWAEENLRANGFEGGMYKCLAMDAEEFVDKALDEGGRYDIIIFDPPSFSNSRKMKGDFDVQRDHPYWLARLFKLLRKDGWILFSTNLGSFRIDPRVQSGSGIREITAQVRAEGFSHRTGASRSWILEKDDESLKTRWDDGPARRPRAARDKGRPFDRGFGKERQGRSDRPFGRNEWRDDRPPRRDRDDRPARRFDDERPPRRFDDDRPPRRFDDDRPPRRDWDDRPPRRDRDERPPRRFDDDRPPRRDRDDRPPRRFDDERPPRRFDDDRPHRRFDDDRPPRRDWDDRPPRRFDDDRPRRRFDDERPPRREWDDRPPRRFDDDRPRRRFDDDRPPRRYDDDRPPRRDRDDRPARKESKPFGYDGFAPTRDRSDSERFFWMDEEKPEAKERPQDIEAAEAQPRSEAATEAAVEVRPEAAAEAAPEAVETRPEAATEAAPEVRPEAVEAAPVAEAAEAREPGEGGN